MTAVVDASTCIAALTDSGPDGRWAEIVLSGASIVAPHLLQVECANVLRRLCTSGKLSGESSSAAYVELMSLPVDLYPFEPFAERVWTLRHNLSSYDAWYVALAEALDAPLATLDRRLVNAAGPRCEFVSMKT